MLPTTVVPGRVRARHLTSAVIATGLMLIATACGAPTAPSGSTSDASKATSAADLGGMDKLVEAAKKEGQLNVIALPPDWANYGEIISTFKSKYGITVNSAQPDANSQDEINAAKQLKGQSRAPDVFDVGVNVGLANASLFAPYKVTTWNDIPDNLKDSGSRWYSDYGGYSSIGYDAKRVPAVTSVNDLLKPAYKGKVALNGDPTKASAGFHGVVMAALANGGSADNIQPGVDFFKRLKQAGNFLPVDPTPATIQSGATPVVIDWEYLNAGYSTKFAGQVDWKVFVPSNGLVGAYYLQAINKDAPHPAAARLWEEFLYSNQGQNLWLKGLARPVRFAAMEQAGSVDAALAAKLPKPTGTPVILTQEQITKGQDALKTSWSAAVG